MKKTTVKKILLSGMWLFIALLILSLRPISTSKDNCLPLAGKVETSFLDPSTHNLSITLSGDTRRFYVNRTIEKGLDTPELLKKITTAPVKILYADHWTPLDPFGSNRHITELWAGKELVFKELGGK